MLFRIRVTIISLPRFEVHIADYIFQLHSLSQAFVMRFKENER